MTSRPYAAVLKGGLVLELRRARARSTRDIDLRVMGTPTNLLRRLQATAMLDLCDFMASEVVPHPGGRGGPQTGCGHPAPMASA